MQSNPFEGYTLGPVVTDLERLTGRRPARVHVGKAYCGQTHQQKFRVWILRHVTAAIRREIVHPKVEHRMDRNHLEA